MKNVLNVCFEMQMCQIFPCSIKMTSRAATKACITTVTCMTHNMCACEVCCRGVGKLCRNVDVTNRYHLAQGGAGGSEVLTGLTPPFFQSLSHAGGCSSMRKATSPQIQPSAPSSPRWKEWATPMWMGGRVSGMWPTMSSHRRLVISWLWTLIYWSLSWVLKKFQHV